MQRWPAVLLISALCVLGAAFAAEISFSAVVDRDVVGVGEQLQLTVTVQGNVSRVPQPELPSLDGLENLGSTRSSSTNISFINGRLQQSNTIDFIYFLTPLRAGELAIGPCRITVGGAEYTTASITITATKEKQGRARPQQPPTPLDPFGFFATPSQPQQSAGGSDADLATAVDRTTGYQGEQITVTYTFYTTGEPGQLGIKRAPSFSGFWADNLYEASQLSYKTRSHKGKTWHAAVIRQVALFPMQSGELTVDGMTLSGTLLEPGFFGYAQSPFEVSSDPVRVTVKPLPEEGRPAGFTGGVGDFRVNAGLSRDTSSGGEPLSLAIRVTGTGNIGLVAAPALPEQPGVKALAPETKDNISNRDGRSSGTRDFIYPLMPQADGKYVVPELSLGFFDPKSGQYYTLTTQRLEFVATGTAAAAAAAGDGGVRVLGKDILHIKPVLAGALFGWAMSWWEWLFYPAGALALVAGALAGRHRRRLERDRGYARRTRSSRLVRQRLKHATQLLGRGRPVEFYAALAQAMTGFVGDRFNIEAGAMTRDQLRAELETRGVQAAGLTRLMALVGQCDIARFSPGMTECDPRDLLAQAEELLEKL
jgi:hypothetical protein